MNLIKGEVQLKPIHWNFTKSYHNIGKLHLSFILGKKIIRSMARSKHVIILKKQWPQFLCHNDFSMKNIM